MERRSLIVVLIGIFALLGLFSTTNGRLAVPQTMFYSPAQSIGLGMARSYVDIDVGSMTPNRIGIRVDAITLVMPPDSSTENYFEMPETTSVTPFVEVDLTYNNHGHKPKALYGMPHVDIHFYITTKGGSLSRLTPDEDGCEGLSIEGWCRSAQPLPAACCPPGVIQTGATVPFMGSHLVDPTYAGPLTKVFIWGAADGMINFMELKASIPFLTQLWNGTLTSECSPIPNYPQEFKIAGYYPKTYCVNYISQRSAFEFELKDFVYFEAGCLGEADSCKLTPPKDLPSKCKCKKYPPYPKFEAVPPPAGTGLSTTTGTSETTGAGHSHSSSGTSGTGTSTSGHSHSSGGSGASSGGHSHSSGGGGSEHDHSSGSSGHEGHSSGSSGHEGHSGSSHEDHSGSAHEGHSESGESGGHLSVLTQTPVHNLYMISLAIIGFFFLIIAVSFTIYGTSVSIALLKAQKNNLQMRLIAKMVLITLLLTAIFAARVSLIIWENITHRHIVNSEYMWITYFLPEIIPALLILSLDWIQIFNEKKRSIAATMATLGFTTKSKANTASAVSSSKTKSGVVSSSGSASAAHSTQS